MPRHDHDAGGRAEDLAAKAALREEVWAALTAAIPLLGALRPG
jgi:5-formyltetrahydrofolate cyclo-ligase